MSFGQDLQTIHTYQLSQGTRRLSSSSTIIPHGPAIPSCFTSSLQHWCSTLCCHHTNRLCIKSRPSRQFCRDTSWKPDEAIPDVKYKQRNEEERQLCRKYGRISAQCTVSLPGAYPTLAQQARHAQSLGVDAIAAVSPSYYKPKDEVGMVDIMASVAGAAPQTPFYFYDNKKRTGIDIDCKTFLEMADGRIPTLRGLKHQSGLSGSAGECRKVRGGKFQVLMGADPYYINNLRDGIPGNMVQVYMGHFMPRLKDAFYLGDMDTAQSYQDRVLELTAIAKKHGGTLGVVKCIDSTMSGLDLGPVRLPLSQPSVEEQEALRRDLAESWIHTAVGMNSTVRPV